jgi:serine/threonine-protein kinase
MSPEQAAGEREIDGRSDLYSLGIVGYQMLSGELPFHAPTVAGILMKQITEVAPDIRSVRTDVPEDLALAVSRCLEKDPQNRWPTADALRRALETRSVGAYQPTGLGFRAARRERERAGESGSEPQRGREFRPPVPPVPRRSRPLPSAPARSRPLPPSRSDDTPLPQTGEPEVILRARASFAKWAATSLGCFGINVATGIESPWFLFPTFGMGIGLLRSYGKAWQAGYGWRDILTRPPAPDAYEATTMIKGGKLPRQMPPPRAEEFGAQLATILQAHGDRVAIYKLIDRLPPSERQLLPEISSTVDGLYARACDLARTLHAMDSNFSSAGLEQIEQRLTLIQREPDDPERARRIALLEKQRQTVVDLQTRRAQVAGHLESCVLAMQNVRFDLLRLRSAGVNAVLGDLTNATQQAKALSRDVDHAIAAAGEIREAMK